MLLHRPFPILAAALLAACNQNLAPEADGPQAGAADARQVKLGSADARRVDPATLMPDPVLASDPDTDWDCRTVGAGVKCVGHKTTIEEGIDIGTCDAATLYVNGLGTRDQVRLYNSDLLEISRDVHLGAEEKLGLSPDGQGLVLSAQQNILQKITFLVPGDLDSRVHTESGLYLQLRAPHGGVIFQQAGPQSYDENNELLGHRGRFDDDFLCAVCAALLTS